MVSRQDPNNEQAVKERREASENAMRDLVQWMNEVVPKRLDKGEDRFISGDFGAIAFFDATNTSTERRRWIVESVKPTGAKVAFLESIITTSAVEYYYSATVRLSPLLTAVPTATTVTPAAAATT